MFTYSEHSLDDTLANPFHTESYDYIFSDAVVGVFANDSSRNFDSAEHLPKTRLCRSPMWFRYVVSTQISNT